jgi:hypothetical protein
VFAYSREVEGERMLIALNFTQSALVVSLGAGSAKVALSTDHARDGEPVDLARVELSADEGVVLMPG